jgi:hypothetical protein
MEPQGFNWVTRSPTGHLPPAIHELVKKLKRKGHDESSAVAIAVAAAKRFAALGHAKWGEAVGQWEAMKATHDTFASTTVAQRELRDWERHMSLGEIGQAIDNARTAFQQAAGSAALMVARQVAADPNSADLHTADLEQAILAELHVLYAAGRQTVADELERQGAPPATHSFADSQPPGELRARARVAAEGILTRIVAMVKRLAVTGRKEPHELQTAAETEAAAGLKAEALVHAAPALNLGRADEAAANTDLIRGAYYTSILHDKNRCERCALADDDTLRSLNDPVRLRHRPPNPDCYGGDRCRCMEAFVLRSESSPSF